MPAHPRAQQHQPEPGDALRRGPVSLQHVSQPCPATQRGLGELRGAAAGFYDRKENMVTTLHRWPENPVILGGELLSQD